MATTPPSLDLGFAGACEQPRRLAHQHPEIEINFLMDGEITYLVRGTLIQIPARQLVIFWAATPHQSVKVDASRFYWFTIPLTWIFQWNIPVAFINELMEGRLLIDDFQPGEALDYARWVTDIHSANLSLREAAELEIRARVLRFALRRAESVTVISSNPIPVSASGHLRVEKIARYITEHYLEDITASQIGKAASLNVNYASTLFRRHCGMSPWEYLMLHRAYHAHRLLTTTDKKVISVAFNSGFQSLSRFYAVFERVFKCSPNKVRSRLSVPAKESIRN